MTASAQRAQLRRAIEDYARTGGVDAAQRELAWDLVAGLHAQATGAPTDPYFAHNAAVLVARGADDPAGGDLAAPLARAAAPILAEALQQDPDDLALALALALNAREQETPREVLEATVGACARPHAGDRLPAIVAEALAARADEATGDDREWFAGAAQRVIERLDAVLAREPEREAAAMARLELLLVAAGAPAATDRQSAYQRLWTLFEDAESTFGPAAARDRLRARVAAQHILERDTKPARKVISDAVKAAQRLASGATPEPEPVVALHNALRRRRWLTGETATAMAEALEALAGRLPGDATVRSALTDALRSTGDTETLIEHHTDLVRSGQADEQSRQVLAAHWAEMASSGAPSGLAAEIEAWVAEKFPAEIARRLSPTAALLLMERVAETVGPQAAGELASRVLMRQRKLASSAPLVVRAVQLLADAGDPEGALKLGHARLSHADSADLRLTLAKIHLGSGIRVAEADTVLKPLSSAGGAEAAEAKVLRDQTAAHPDFAASRLRAMLEVEERLGIGTDKQVRCRVIFPSDRYALAEMPGVRAPSFYQHRYLRVMIQEKDLPEGISIGDLAKGYELTTTVVGEDDHKEDRIRVYWTGPGKITPLGAPSGKGRGEKKSEQDAADKPARKREPVEAPSEETERAFNVGTDEPALVRIDRSMRRLLLGYVLKPDGSGEEFPVRVGIHRRFVPDSLKIEQWRGVVVRCQVARASGPKLRYDATSEVELVSQPEPEAPQAVAAPDGPTERGEPSGDEAPKPKTPPASGATAAGLPEEGGTPAPESKTNASELPTAAGDTPAPIPTAEKASEPEAAPDEPAEAGEKPDAAS